MKSVRALCLILTIGFAHCGTISSLVRTPNVIIRSDRVGGNFAYSTVEGQAYTIAQPVAVSYAHPVFGAFAPFTISQPLYTQTLVGHQPIYSQNFFGSAPIFSTPVVAPQRPVVGQNPVVGGGSAPANPAPTPVEGTIVDDDTVSVESA